MILKGKKVLISCGLLYDIIIFDTLTGLKIDEFSREKMDKTAQELIEEKTLANSCL